MVDPRPTVFIVDDDERMRRSCDAVLRHAELQTELFASAGDFLRRYERSLPGCLLLDIRMPDMSGLEVQKELISRSATIAIVFLTGVAEIPVAVEAMKLGAFHYLQKPVGMEALLESVQRALAFDATTRPSQLERQQAQARLAVLTERERLILSMIASGLPNKEVAARLQLSARTVEIHRAGLMKKIGARSAAHLIRMAIEAGIRPEGHAKS